MLCFGGQTCPHPLNLFNSYVIFFTSYLKVFNIFNNFILFLLMYR